MHIFLYMLGGGFLMMGGLFTFFGINAFSVMIGVMMIGVGVISMIGAALVSQNSAPPRGKRRHRRDYYDDDYYEEPRRIPQRRKRKSGVLPSGLVIEAEVEEKVSDEEEAQTDSGRLPKIKRRRISQRRR